MYNLYLVTLAIYGMLTGNFIPHVHISQRYDWQGRRWSSAETCPFHQCWCPRKELSCQLQGYQWNYEGNIASVGPPKKLDTHRVKDTIPYLSSLYRIATGN